MFESSAALATLRSNCLAYSAQLTSLYESNKESFELFFCCRAGQKSQKSDNDSSIGTHLCCDSNRNREIVIDTLSQAFNISGEETYEYRCHESRRTSEQRTLKPCHLAPPAFSTSLLDSFIALMFAYEEGCEPQLAFAGTINIASPYEKKR
jgi:hypothetical protein